MTPRSLAVGAAAVTLGLFLALSYAVHRGTFFAFDARARTWFWPSGEWGTPQRLEDVVVNLCQPTVTAIVLGVVAAVSARRRRSPWPLIAAVGLIVLAAAAVIVVKRALAVPDVHGSTAHLGGSYPSGHMVGIICFGGGVVLLGRRRLRAWLCLALLTVIVAACLLLTSVHWVTDVVAGALLGTFLLLLAAQVPVWRPAAGFNPRARERWTARRLKRSSMLR